MKQTKTTYIFALALFFVLGFALSSATASSPDADPDPANDVVFAENWDTVSIFAYPDSHIVDFPDLIELRLIERLSDFHTPARGRVSSQFGPRSRYRNHNGIDIPLVTGEPIYATFSGKVRYARMNHGGFGNLVIIRHHNGLETYSAHLHEIHVTVGQEVKAGQLIGLAGNTGRSFGSHLHYEIRYKDQAFDPERVINFENGTLCYQNLALSQSHFNILSRASKELNEEEVFEQDTKNILAAVDVHTMDNEFEEPIYHTVKNGDTIIGISVKYGVRVSQICELSGIRMDQTLKLGRKLRIR